ncbi:hypothetical protein QU668_10455 [Schaalia sp. HMT-877]|nr:hypothetical protein HMPREF1550_01202 [Actinomyces sp. oral taxon 877 str. F0543]WLD79939.1 hypothetical protein QU668_10455 [Schaalia sp. HMT-877]
MPSDGQFPPVGPPSADPDDVLVPFGAPEADTGGSSPKAKAARGPAAKPRRSRKALRPLLWSLPFVLIGLAASTYLIGLTLWSRASLGHWTDSDYASAQAGYEGQKTLTKSGVEPWVANYNLGTTMLREGDTDGGIGLLRTAKEQVPTATEVEPGRIETYSYECQVRINLALGIEIQGDAKAASADWSGAATAYSEAKDIISPCQSPSSSQDQSGDGEGQSDQQSGGQGGGGGQSDQQSGGQGGGGGQQDPGEQADDSTDRLGDKEQQAKDKQGEGGQDQQDQGGQGQDQKDQGGQGQDQKDQGDQGQDQQQDQGGQGQDQKDKQNKGGQGKSKNEDEGYDNENSSDRQKRQDLQKKNRGNEKDRQDRSDSKRSGNPNGAW